jgi:glycerophosphoryl diester phosphodiesterase
LLSALLACAGAWGQTQACAVRGDVKQAPENTVPAFQRAVEKGAGMIVLDVQFTADNRFVVIHDETVDRTTNGTGKVAEMSFDQIRALDAGVKFAPEFAGTLVPTLREALDVIPPPTRVFIRARNQPGLATDIARVLAEGGRLDQCYLACTDSQIEEARKQVPMVRVCNLTRQEGARGAYLDRSIELKAHAIAFTSASGLEGLAPDVARAHAAGMEVLWFGSNDAGEMRALVAAGVDYIVTADLDLCLTTLQAIKAEAEAAAAAAAAAATPEASPAPETPAPEAPAPEAPAGETPMPEPAAPAAPEADEAPPVQEAPEAAPEVPAPSPAPETPPPTPAPEQAPPPAAEAAPPAAPAPEAAPPPMPEPPPAAPAP